jgi:hypothetical protein
MGFEMSSGVVIDVEIIELAYADKMWCDEE